MVVTGPSMPINSAFDLADRGWPVLPIWRCDKDGYCRCRAFKNCGSPGKHPLANLTPNGHLNATTDYGTISEWWRKYPSANVGARTGKESKIVVVDIDPAHGGDESFLYLEQQYGPLPQTTEVITGGGGRHKVFKYPDDGLPVPCSRGTLASGIDIRADGGYIVAAGSTHQSGNPYVWEASSHPDDVPPAPLPAVWLEAIRKAGNANGDRKPIDLPTILTDGVDEGGRDELLFRTSCALRAAGVPYALAEPLITDAATKCRPPFSKADAIKKVVNAYQRYEPNPTVRFAPDSTYTGITSATDLMAHTFEPAREIVPGILTEGAVILAGRPKLGKSWIGINLAVAVASGGRAFGYIAITDPGDVLLLCLEDGSRRLQRRLKVVLGTSKAPARLSIATEWPGADEGGIQKIATWLEDHNDARLVVIDTLKRIRPRSRGNRRLYDEDYEAIGPLADLAKRHAVCILVVHHTRKAEADDPLDLISGSTGLTGAADAAMVLKRSRGSADAELIVVNRDLGDQEFALHWDQFSCTWNITGPAAEARISDERRAILATLRKSPEPMSPREVAEVTGRSNHASPIKKLMWTMARDGELDNAKGRYSLPNSGNSGNPGNSGNRGNRGNPREGEGNPAVTTVTGLPAGDGLLDSEVTGLPGLPMVIGTARAFYDGLTQQPEVAR